MVIYRINPYALVITLYAEIKGAIIALFGLSRWSIRDRVGREQGRAGQGRRSEWDFVDKIYVT